MKKIGLILFIIILIAGFLIIQANKNKNSVDSVLIGMPKSSSFEQSAMDSRDFFKIFGKARDAKMAGDHDTAIELFNKAIAKPTFGAGYGMVYHELAEIYHVKGDLESELKYVELDSKYSMNKDLNLANEKRAAEIRQILADRSS